MTIHAGGYDRQSDARASGSVASPEAQRRNNYAEAERRRAAGADLVWVGHYSEKPGTSAFRAGVERPEFNRLLHDCRMGRVNMVIVDYVSRFSRLEVMDAIPIVTELLHLGVTIVSTTEGEFRKGNLMDLIHLIMRLDAAHNESKNKSHAVRDAFEIARSLGGHIGRAPYGFERVQEIRYTADGKPIAVYTLKHRTAVLDGSHAFGRTEPDVIRSIWSRIKRHMREPFVDNGPGSSHPGSLTGIVSQMESLGVPTRGIMMGKRYENSRWSVSTIKRILRDPRIAGFQAEPVYNTKSDGTKGTKVVGYRIARDEITMKPLTLECGPIIDPAEWHQLQEWLDGRGRGKGLSRGQALLTAMDIFDCQCGAPVHSNAKANDRHMYICKASRKGSRNPHSGANSIGQQRLDDYVVRRVFALIQTAEGDEDTLETLAEATRRWGKRSEAPESAGERASLLAERADAARALEELYDLQAAGGFTGKIGRRRFLEQKAALTLRMEGAEERLAELDERATPRLPIWEWLPDDPGADPIGPGSWWHSASMDDRREFLKLFIDKITLFKPPANAVRTTPANKRVEIHWAQPAGEDELAA